jgi:hypothetical protein
MIASEVTGRTVKRELVGEREWLAAQIAQRTQEFVARFLLGFYQAVRQGDFAGVDPLLSGWLPRSAFFRGRPGLQR